MALSETPAALGAAIDLAGTSELAEALADAAREAGLGPLEVRDLRPLYNDLAVADPNAKLWQTDTDACCNVRKVLPLDRALADFDAWITGRKRFHGGDRLSLPVVEQAWQVVQRNGAGGPIALFTHGGPVLALLAALGIDDATLETLRIYDHRNPLPPAGVWQVGPGGPSDPASRELHLVYVPPTAQILAEESV